MHANQVILIIFLLRYLVTPEEKKARAEANAPIFLVRLKDTELMESTYLRFMVKVKGDPNPEMKLLVIIKHVFLFTLYFRKIYFLTLFDTATKTMF